MRSEELITLASAHGVDFIAAARLGAPRPKRDTRTKTRFGNVAVILLEASQSGVRGKSSPSFVRPQWTLQEIGMAAQGVPEREFYAALFAFARSDNHEWELHAELTCEGNRLRRMSSWPQTVTDIHGVKIDYVQHLARLVLYDDRYGNMFRVCPALHWLCLNVPERCWDNQLSKPFAQLQHQWLCWLGSAASQMQKKLSND